MNTASESTAQHQCYRIDAATDQSKYMLTLKDSKKSPFLNRFF